jgi:integrase
LLLCEKVCEVGGYVEPREKRCSEILRCMTFMEAKSLVYKIDNYRDYAMVLVMLYGGLRVSEVCNPDREDIDSEEFTIAVRNTKNRIDRTVVVTEKCINAGVDVIPPNLC